MQRSVRRPFDRETPAKAELRALIAKSLRLPLGPYLRQLARASVATVALSAAACSMSHSVVDGGPDSDAHVIETDAGLPPPPPPPPPPGSLCDATTYAYRAVHDLNPVESPTYLAAHTYGEFRGPSWIVDEIGERCGGATDPAACEAELTRVVTETYERALASTDGDTIATRIGPDAFRAFLGAIDTPNEAALLVWQSGYDIYCSGDFLSSVETLADGYRVVAYRADGGCGSPWITTRYVFHVDPMGNLRVEDERVVAETDGGGCIGRRPEGLAPVARGDGSSMNGVGGFFANVARLEESAVAAFDVMIAELESLGAPAALIEAAREARADEVRHTDSMGDIARRYGAEPGRPEVAPPRARTAFEIALENAVEGCVRETFGALVGAHQALRAGDPAIAHAMRAIADDEIRHAELSWALAAWLEPQLTDDERAHVAAAKLGAVAELRREAARMASPELVELAGLPDASAAVAMVDQLARDVWA